jgi:hypothetical protein
MGQTATNGRSLVPAAQLETATSSTPVPPSTPIVPRSPSPRRNPHDNDPKQRKAGLLVRPDDLQAARFSAVQGIKNDPAGTHPILGQAFKLKAMNLPFLVGEPASDPARLSVTFDGRHLDFMRMTPGYVKAQTPSRVPEAG